MLIRAMITQDPKLQLHLKHPEYILAVRLSDFLSKRSIHDLLRLLVLFFFFWRELDGSVFVLWLGQMQELSRASQTERFEEESQVLRRYITALYCLVKWRGDEPPKHGYGMEWVRADEREERPNVIKLILNWCACETPARSSFEVCYCPEKGCRLSADDVSCI